MKTNEDHMGQNIKIDGIEGQDKAAAEDNASEFVSGETAESTDESEGCEYGCAPGECHFEKGFGNEYVIDLGDDNIFETLFGISQQIAEEREEAERAQAIENLRVELVTRQSRLLEVLSDLAQVQARATSDLFDYLEG